MIRIEFLLLDLFILVRFCAGSLYPQESESRQIKDLSGLWWFVAEPKNTPGYGFDEKWWNISLATFNNATRMPLPSSFNELTQSKELRDHVGWVWYQTTFYVSRQWSSERVFLRFGSVNYFASVWLNGENIMSHVGGHLPFETQVSKLLNFDQCNLLTVAVNNTLSHQTIPPGEFQYKTMPWYPKNYFVQTPDFDFFNYAGIHRPVWLYTTPNVYVEDITVTTDISNSTGLISYHVDVNGDTKMDYGVVVTLLDNVSRIVAENNENSGQLIVSNANFWWPRGMNETTVGYMYTLKVFVISNDSKTDIYRLPVGIRSLKTTKYGILINSVPFYFKGCGMHEDSDVRGRGYDGPIMVKDMMLLEWLNANSFRTSHYPYSEERMLEADRRGFVVIDETPAVGLQYFTTNNLEIHKNMLRDLISRDKNHPSVVMWSLANEPKTSDKNARYYFKELVLTAKSLDKTRPVTIVYGVSNYEDDDTADLPDVISLNRYYGWYSNIGHYELAANQLILNLTMWNKKFKKPILVTEYGADSIAGLYHEPPVDFSESYQIAFMAEYHLAFDKMKSRFLIGEMFWNFADFMTDQSTTRAVGNRKGVFTRNRQPKMAAYLMKERYSSLSSIRSPSQISLQFNNAKSKRPTYGRMFGQVESIRQSVILDDNEQ